MQITREELKAKTFNFERRDLMYWLINNCDHDWLTGLMAENIPLSTAINALRIEPEIEISVRIRNNIIYIKPKQSWTDQFTIFISRNLEIQINFGIL